MGFYHAQKIWLHKIKERITKATTFAMIMHNCMLESFTITAGRSNRTIGVRGHTAGDWSTEHNRQKRMDTSKAPTHSRADLQRQGGQDEIESHAIPESLHQGVLLHRIPQVSSTPGLKNPPNEGQLEVGIQAHSPASRDGIEVMHLPWRHPVVGTTDDVQGVAKPLGVELSLPSHDQPRERPRAEEAWWDPCKHCSPHQ